MSLESGKRSAAEMRAAQREKISQAEAAVPAVVVTEKNWLALIDSQKVQVKTLGEILETLGTLTTEAQLVAYMDRQVQILQEDADRTAQATEQYRQTLIQEAKSTTWKMQELAKDMERRAGKMNEEFGNRLWQEAEQMKRTSKKLFWISMIPSLILAVWELMRHIWLLG